MGSEFISITMLLLRLLLVDDFQFRVSPTRRCSIG